MYLSIIIPVYNVELYIEQCIKSLCNINLDSMEILVIDDGSKDRSIDLVKNIEDKRIKIISQENGGLSSARNTGLANAIGKYVLFIDGDDFIINQDKILDLLTLAESTESDVVIGNGYKYFSEDKKMKINRPKEIYKKLVYQGDEYLKTILKYNSFTQVVWLNLYKLDFLKENSLFFKEGIYHEDLHFTPRMLLKAKRIAISRDFFYMYRQRENSITTNTNQKKNVLDIYHTLIELKEVVETLDSKYLKVKMYEFIFDNFLSTLTRIYHEDIDLALQIVTELGKIKKNIKRFDQKIYYYLLNINVGLGFYIIVAKNKLKLSIKKLLY